MAFDAVTWALRQRPATSSAKFVLVVLAESANAKPWTSRTGRSWPPMHALMSVAALSEATMQDRKTVIANLGRLEQDGLIARAGTDGRTNQIPVFRLAIDLPEKGTENGTVVETFTDAEIGTVPKAAPVPVSPLNSTDFPIEQSQFSAPPIPKTGHGTRRLVLNQEEPKQRVAAPAFDALSVELPPWLAADAWAMFVRHRADIRKPLRTQDAVRLSIKSLSGFREQGVDASAVIEHAVASGNQGLFLPPSARAVNGRPGAAPGGARSLLHAEEQFR